MMAASTVAGSHGQRRVTTSLGIWVALPQTGIWSASVRYAAAPDLALVPSDEACPRLVSAWLTQTRYELYDTCVTSDLVSARTTDRSAARPDHQATGMKSRGQALVEFALIVPVFLFLLMAVIDGGRYVFMNSVLSNAAREGGRLASAEARHVFKTTVEDPSCVANEAAITAANPGAHVCPANDAALLTNVTDAVKRQLAPFGPGTVNLACISKAAQKVRDDAGTHQTPAVANSVTCANRNAGDFITVRVRLDWTALTPLVGNILGPRTLEGNATYVIN